MAFAGWCSAVVASVGCAAQLAWSGTVPWGVAFPAMVGVHMLIGLGEGLISALVLLAVLRTRPDLVLSDAAGGRRPAIGGVVALGLIVALGLALFVAPFACPWPDGLESVAAHLGFGASARPHMLPAPAPDYLMPGIGSRGLATALAGAAGALVAFGLALALSRLLVRDRGAEPDPT
jgi:cobalt/nickel transport system permease protein